MTGWMLVLPHLDRYPSRETATLSFRVVGVKSAIRKSRTRLPHNPQQGSCLVLASKMAFKEFPRPAFALFAEHNRLRLRLRVGDVPPGMETSQRLPVVRLPRSPLTRRCQPQQRQNHLVDFVVVV